MSGFFRSTLRAETSERAEERLRELYGDVRIGGVGKYEERVLGDERFSVARVTLDGAFDVEATCEGVTFATSTPGYAWRVGRDEGDLSRRPAVFQPDQPMASRIAGPTTVTTVTFATDAISDLAEAVYGGDTRVWFASQTPINDRAASAWTQMVDTVTDDIDLDDDFYRATVFHALAVSALEHFRLAGDRPERHLTAAGSLRLYRRAAAFIDDNPEAALTAADVARSIGVAEREIRIAFRAHSPQGQTVERRILSGRSQLK